MTDETYYRERIKEQKEVRKLQVRVVTFISVFWLRHRAYHPVAFTLLE